MCRPFLKCIRLHCSEVYYINGAKIIQTIINFNYKILFIYFNNTKN